MLSRLIRTAKALLLEIWRFKSSPIKAAFNWLAAYRNGLFSPDEIRRYGLAHPTKGERRQQKYGSKEMADRFYTRHNPRNSENIITDKIVFEQICIENGLSGPNSFGAYFNGQVTTLDGKVYREKEQLENFFSNVITEPCILKPNNSSLGTGMACVHQLGDGRVDFSGEIIAQHEFLDRMQSFCDNNSAIKDNAGPEYLGLLMQKRLKNHEEILRLTGFELLQTVRVCTYLDPDDQVRILFCFFKLAAAEGLADAFDVGRTGNMIADVDIKTGRLNETYYLSLKDNFFKTRSDHPITGHRIEGFQLPHWDACLELTRKLALCFDKTRAIGWDIAITDQGPVVLEGNENWVPMSPYKPSFQQLKSYGLK